MKWMELVAALRDGCPYEVGSRHDLRHVIQALLHPDRQFPIVGVTTTKRERRCWIDVDQLARRTADSALVVVFPTGWATHALDKALSPSLGVFDGFVRIWWPGLRVGTRPDLHRRFRLRGKADGERVLEVIVEWLDRTTQHLRSACSVTRQVPAGSRQGVAVPWDVDGDVGELGNWHSNV